MGSAFDAELDRLHAEADRQFGVQARFRGADGVNTPCMVEKLLPRPEFGFGKAKTTAPALVLMVQVAALPRRPIKGDVFDLIDADGNVIETLHVQGAPTIDDDDGRRFTIKVDAA